MIGRNSGFEKWGMVLRWDARTTGKTEGAGGEREDWWSRGC